MRIRSTWTAAKYHPIGVSAQALTPALAESFNIDSDHGLLIAGVLENGPADQAGLQPGDLILEVDDQPAYSSPQMLNFVAAKQPGDRVRHTGHCSITPAARSMASATWSLRRSAGLRPLRGLNRSNSPISPAASPAWILYACLPCRSNVLG